MDLDNIYYDSQGNMGLKRHFCKDIGWIRGKVSPKILLCGIGCDIKCPFCGIYNNNQNSLHICSGCGRKFYEKNNGDYVYKY